MKAYYNEIDQFAAEWLRKLIEHGLIAEGDVDERSIVDVQPDDLRSYERYHFFAGIGGWDYALRLASWDGPVWTGSCPCQPFSVAGQQRGSEDERHLWPAFFRLISECRPPVVFGEQVAGAAGLAWLDHVCADLEGAGYAVAAADLPACSIGAPHRRQRLWWVADARRRELRNSRLSLDGTPRKGESEAHQRKRLWANARDGRDDGDMAYAEQRRCESRGYRSAASSASFATEICEPNHWNDIIWLPCSDGKARPTQPGIFPLAHGIPNRVGILRGAGNAIVPQVAAEFVKAVMDCRP